MERNQHQEYNSTRLDIREITILVNILIVCFSVHDPIQAHQSEILLDFIYGSIGLDPLYHEKWNY